MIISWHRKKIVFSFLLIWNTSYSNRKIVSMRLIFTVFTPYLLILFYLSQHPLNLSLSVSSNDLMRLNNCLDIYFLSLKKRKFSKKLFQMSYFFPSPRSWFLHSILLQSFFISFACLIFNIVACVCAWKML